MRFDPHLRNGPRYREGLVMEPLREVEVALLEAPLPRWVCWRRSVPRIRVSWPGGEALFGVPDATAVYGRLADRLAAPKTSSI